MKEDDAVPFTRERFEKLKAAAERNGFTVVTRWRPGLKRIRLSEIVLGEIDLTVAVSQQEYVK
jgi:hypothetical protein